MIPARPHINSRPSSHLAYRESGEGPVLVICHGIYGTGRLFDDLRAELASDGRVIVPDMRGHGDSTGVGGPMDAHAVASDVLRLLDDLGVDRVDVLGHSHGGATAQALAHLAPDRVRSLTLVGTYAALSLTWWERLGRRVNPWLVRLLWTRAIAGLVRVTRSSVGGPRLAPAVAARLAGEIRRNPAERMAEAFAACRPFDSRPWLAALPMPVLVIHGDRDHMVSRRQVAALTSGLPDARAVIVPGAGHMLPLTHHRRLAEETRAWLRAVRSGTHHGPGPRTP